MHHTIRKIPLATDLHFYSQRRAVIGPAVDVIDAAPGFLTVGLLLLRPKSHAPDVLLRKDAVHKHQQQVLITLGPECVFQREIPLEVYERQVQLRGVNRPRFLLSLNCLLFH